MQRYKVPFMLGATVHGPVILHTLDWKQGNDKSVELGVGLDLMIHGEFDLAMISLTVGAIEARHRQYGPGVIALDCGANIGIYSLEWARAMADYGMVIAFEPQERIYYALCGNLALNNHFNVKALNQAVGRTCEIIDMPAPDYRRPAQFGGLNLKGPTTFGQAITERVPVEVVTIDSLELPRVDFIKLDIEGMEVEALEGARFTILKNQPFILAEWHICGFEPLQRFFGHIKYDVAKIGMNVIAGPQGSEVMERMRQVEAMADEHNARQAANA